jgi:RimJ/RimL family protein N-acetyltransferase
MNGTDADYRGRVVHPAYPIETERLLLRPLDPDGDTEDVYAYTSRPDVCRYIPFEPKSRDQVREFLATRRATLDDEGQPLGLAAVLRETGRVIGDLVLFWRSREHGCGELGYVFNPRFHGHGYATEACAAVLEIAFDGLGLHRVIARIDARNDPSAGVLRRLGMRQEAYLVQNEWFKGEWSDEIDFAILASEWRDTRPIGRAS